MNCVILTTLCLSFLIYEVGVGVIISHGVWVRIERINACKAHTYTHAWQNEGLSECDVVKCVGG